MKKMRTVIAGVVISSVLTACAPHSTRPDVYTRGELRQAQATTYATILSVKPIYIEGESSQLFNVATAAIGAIAASHVGGGTGRIVSGIAGGLGAGYVADKIGKQITSSNGAELTVVMDNGSHVTFAQEGDPNRFAKGQRVKLVKNYANEWRVDNR